MPGADGRRRIGRLARWPRLQDAAQWVRRVVVPSERAVHRLRRDAGESLLQPWPVTAPDRHPALFAFARDQLASLPRPEILSFGCSTGEEPLSLAQYLPRAAIDAIDINPRSLAIARRRARKAGVGNVRFALGAMPPDRAAAYDAIFCLSVLRHGELDAFLPDSCSEILPFASFARIIAAFDHCLRPGGLLFIWGSNFDFADTAAAASYVAIPVAGAAPHPGPIYGPDDRLRHQLGMNRFVFRKRGTDDLQGTVVAEEGHFF